MKPRRLLPALALALLAGCSTAPPGQDWLALPAGLVLASDAGLLKLPVAAAALAFYVVADPWRPTGSSRRPGRRTTATSSRCA
jgi:uncharacterized lipoprotein YmbA